MTSIFNNIYIYLFIMLNTSHFLIKKIRKFYKEKDPVFDHMLATYFYSKEDLYQEFKLLVENEDVRSIDHFKIFKKAIEISSILSQKDDIINYINVDYKVYYVIDPIRVKNEKIIMGIYKRIHTLLLLAMLNIYIIYHNKYTLICDKVEINISIITVFLLCILYIIHRYIAKEALEQWVENIKMKLYFYILIISYIVIISYVFLKNKLDNDMVDIIVNIKDILKIRENFTLPEKYKYMRNYIELLKKNGSYDIKILLKYEENPPEVLQMTLEKFKISLHEIYQEIKLQEELNEMKKTTLLQKIFKIKQ